MAANDCFLSSGLWLNVAKTKYMLVHSSQHIPTSALEVQLNGRIIDQVQRYRFLGVITTDTLSWSDHIDQVCSKASRGLNLVEISMVPPKECSSLLLQCLRAPPPDVCSPIVEFLHQGSEHQIGRASKLCCLHYSTSPWVRLCHLDAKGTGPPCCLGGP